MYRKNLEKEINDLGWIFISKKIVEENLLLEVENDKEFIIINESDNKIYAYSNGLISSWQGADFNLEKISFKSLLEKFIKFIENEK